jgi:alpha-galactosidase
MCIAAIGCCISAAAPAPVVFPDDALAIKGDLGSFRAEWKYEHPQAGLTLATLTFSSPQPAVPPPFEVTWKFPAVDLAGTWTCDIGKSHLDHQGTDVESRAVLRAPLLMFLGPDDGNRFLVACSDTMRPLKISGGVVEEDLNIHASVKLFAGKQAPLKDYSITFRFDTRTEPYYAVLRDTARWWAAQDGYHPAPVPESARTPLYSTWYSYHQSLNPDTIVEECRLGGEIGLGGVIVDDGWQTLDSSRGYAFTGDWKPERIPDFK